MTITAIKSETYSWMPYTKSIGFELFRDDVKLPGLFVIDTENLEFSFDGEFQRLQTSHGICDATTKITAFGPWFDPIDRDEILSAIKLALSPP